MDVRFSRIGEVQLFLSEQQADVYVYSGLSQNSLYKGTRKYHVKALMAIQRVNQ